MTTEQILEEIGKLPVNEQLQLSGRLHELVRVRARRQLRVGSRVSFTTRHGVRVQGVVERVNVKSVKVKASTDRYGVATQFPVMWTVSPELVTVEQ